MAEKVVGEVLVNVPVDKFFDVIVDYASYPQFVPSVLATKVSGNGPTKDVEYQLDLKLKKIKYTLRHVENRPSGVTWTLVGGEMMKTSNGSWELSDEGGKTRGKYTAEVQIAKPALVPQSIVDKITEELTRVQLPKMLEAFKARAERTQYVPPRHFDRARAHLSPQSADFSPFFCQLGSYIGNPCEKLLG
jgi:coenzyme Q-binding protein COQ10